MPSNVSQIINDPGVFATTSLAILLDKFGAEMFGWDPIALSLEMRGAFGAEPEDEVFDRIMAGIGIISNNSFFVDVESFMHVCNALNFGVVMSEYWIPADLDDVLWGVTEAKMLLGEDYDEKHFSSDVRRYVGVLLQQEGIKKVPSILQFAELDEDAEATYASFGGDEVMEQTFWDEQQKDKDDLEKLNMERLRAMMAQVATLPIKSEYIDHLRKTL